MDRRLLIAQLPLNDVQVAEGSSDVAVVGP
jgi:hypothetical protein